jgi:hypothetical protein
MGDRVGTIGRERLELREPLNARKVALWVNSPGRKGRNRQLTDNPVFGEVRNTLLADV